MDIKYAINITESAQKDLNSIYFYFSDNLFEEETAINIISALKEAIFSLDVMPGRYTLVNEFSLAKMGYRHISVKNYIVLYLINEKKKTVAIARIVHEKMNYTKFLTQP